MSRFSQLQSSIENKEGYSAGRAAAIAAAAGRKKYGAKKMARMAAAGRKKAAKAAKPSY